MIAGTQVESFTLWPVQLADFADAGWNKRCLSGPQMNRSAAYSLWPCGSIASILTCIGRTCQTCRQ